MSIVIARSNFAMLAMRTLPLKHSELNRAPLPTPTVPLGRRLEMA